MEANRIVDALSTAMQKTPPTNGTVFVCNATEDEWNTFVDRDDHPIKVNYLQWIAETNQIHIVEFGPSQTHEAFVGALNNIFQENRNFRQWVMFGGCSKNTQGPAYLPDLSYGPKGFVPGAQLAQGVAARQDFKTIKVEIGVSQDWGNAAGQLDHKARTVWAPMAGVEFVLCIKTDDNLTDASYKLYDVAANGPPPQFTVQPNPVPIVPGTVVTFDACRVLGIPAGGQPPAGFPDPLVVDLHAALVEARTNLPI